MWRYVREAAGQQSIQNPVLVRRRTSARRACISPCVTTFILINRKNVMKKALKKSIIAAVLAAASSVLSQTKQHGVKWPDVRRICAGIVVLLSKRKVEQMQCHRWPFSVMPEGSLSNSPQRCGHCLRTAPCCERFDRL
jgi:hypothetical protein